MATITTYPKREDIIEIFDYDPQGFLIWKHSKQGRTKKVSGSQDKSGYSRVCIDYQRYMVSRIIWIFHNGDIPGDHEIDHIDSDPTNNKIENLQLVNKAQNRQKRRAMRNNTSGYRGVSYNKSKSKWFATICANGTRIRLGYFNDLEEAARAYDRASIQYHGDFANTNFPRQNYELVL